MKRKEFADKLCDYMEKRIVEICSKFEKGNVNHASLPAFYMGLEGDIESFLEENKLCVRKSQSREKTNGK